MSIKQIRSALLKAHKDGDFGLPRQMENRPYKPVTGTPWSQVHFIPNDPSVATNATDKLDGIFQISLNYPLNKGDGAAHNKAGAIRAVFKAGTRLSYQSQYVTIKSCGIGAGKPVDGWYRTPITIYWTARLAR